MHFNTSIQGFFSLSLSDSFSFCHYSGNSNCWWIKKSTSITKLHFFCLLPFFLDHRASFATVYGVHSLRDACIRFHHHLNISKCFMIPSKYLKLSQCISGVWMKAFWYGSAEVKWKEKKRNNQHFKFDTFFPAWPKQFQAHQQHTLYREKKIHRFWHSCISVFNMQYAFSPYKHFTIRQLQFFFLLSICITFCHTLSPFNILKLAFDIEID